MTVTNAGEQERRQVTPRGTASDSADDAFPRPWTKPEDREGWEVVARGRGRKDRPPVGTAIIVSLNREQATWVREQAVAAGVSMEQFVTRLIEQTRSA